MCYDKNKDIVIYTSDIFSIICYVFNLFFILLKNILYYLGYCIIRLEKKYDCIECLEDSCYGCEIAKELDKEDHNTCLCEGSENCEKKD